MYTIVLTHGSQFTSSDKQDGTLVHPSFRNVCPTTISQDFRITLPPLSKKCTVCDVSFPNFHTLTYVRPLLRFTAINLVLLTLPLTVPYSSLLPVHYSEYYYYHLELVHESTASGTHGLRPQTTNGITSVGYPSTRQSIRYHTPYLISEVRYRNMERWVFQVQEGCTFYVSKIRLTRFSEKFFHFILSCLSSDDFVSSLFH